MSFGKDQCAAGVQVPQSAFERLGASLGGPVCAPRVEIKDLTDEEWREYEWVYTERGLSSMHVVRIERPQGLVLGNTTHRVIDSWGTVHCVPAVGMLGCVVRWRVKEGRPYVAF